MRHALFLFLALSTVSANAMEFAAEEVAVAIRNDENSEATNSKKSSGFDLSRTKNNPASADSKCLDSSDTNGDSATSKRCGDSRF